MDFGSAFFISHSFSSNRLAAASPFRKALRRPGHAACSFRPPNQEAKMAQKLDPKMVKELILQALEHERGGVKIYETALKCAVNEDLKEEWEKYHQETEHHVEILQDVCSQLQLDAEEQTPG